jgi:type VI secretion system protein ImpA
MTLDVEALLAPVSESEPSGPDLSYDPEFRRISRELDEAAQKEKPSEDPNMPLAAQTAANLLTRSKDLWIGSHGFCCALYSGDLDTCAGMLDVIAGIAERFWDTCHPALDEGSDPAGGRREACRQIASIGRSVRHLERVQLGPLRNKGKLSFRDVTGGADASLTAAQLVNQMPEAIRRAVDETQPADWQALSDLLGRMLAATARIVAVFNAKTSGQGPDLSLFDAAAGRIKGLCDAIVAARLPAAAVSAAADSLSGGQAAAVGPVISGPIRSRQQAIDQLDAVKAFFLAAEPSSPLPLLIDRVKRLAGMDFMQIMENLAPGGVDDAAKVLEPPTKDDD